jgi:hypothetical protein
MKLRNGLRYKKNEKENEDKEAQCNLNITSDGIRISVSPILPLLLGSTFHVVPWNIHWIQVIKVI